MNITDPFLMSLNTLWPLAIILVMWSALTVYVFIKAPTKYYLRFTLIPGMLFGSILMIMSLVNSLGFSVALSLPDEFEFLAFKVVLDKEYKKSAIEVWVADKKTRLYVIPYTEKTEKALKEAAGKKKQGNSVIVRKGTSTKEGSGAGGMMEDDYESNIILPHQAFPKDGAPAEPEVDKSKLI